jgi:hypothetical protein
MMHKLSIYLFYDMHVLRLNVSVVSLRPLLHCWSWTRDLGHDIDRLTLESELKRPSLASVATLFFPICPNLACYLIELDIILEEVEDVIKAISLLKCKSKSNMKKIFT